MKNDPAGLIAAIFIFLLACALAPSGGPTTAYSKAAKLPRATQAHAPMRGLPACLIEHVAGLPC